MEHRSTQAIFKSAIMPLIEWDPVLSWNGQYYLVVWTATPDGNNWFIYGRMFDSEGRPMNYADIQLQGDGTSKAFPAILADSENEELLVWEEGPGQNSNISAALIVPGYRIFSGAARPISDPQETDASFPVLSKSGDDVLVVWQAKDGNGNWQIYGRQLFKSGPSL